MSRTKIDRIEAGDRTLTIEEAWRFIEVFEELPVLEFLRAANVIDEDASQEFRAMIEDEAARRRDAYRQGGNRRRSERSMKVVSHASDIVAATVSRGPAAESGDLPEALRAVRASDSARLVAA